MSENEVGGWRDSALVRWPRKWMAFLRHRALPGPSTIEITLQDLAPLWLRHNDDFRPLTRAGTRIGTDAEMTMVEAFAPPPRPERNGPLHTASAPARTDAQAVPPAAVTLPASSHLVRDYIMPHQGLLHTQGVLVPLLKIIEMIETYGDCPSVVLESKTSDEECVDLYSIRDTLATVSLKDHTHRVTRHGVAMLAQTYKDPEPLIPKMLVACLGHDLGKIPAFRASGIYSMRDHPAVSIVKVKEAFEGHDVFWLEEACEVIGAHHRHVRDGFASLLKEADGRAREEEVAYASQSMEIKRWEEWFQVGEFLAVLDPLINQGGATKGRKEEWVGVTLDGVVYCQTSALYGVVRELARQKRVVDIHLLRASDRDDILRRVAKSLGEAGVLAEKIGEGFYGRKYTFRLRSQSQFPVYCLPIVETAFQTSPSAFESRKRSFLKQIQGVVQ